MPGHVTEGIELVGVKNGPKVGEIHGVGHSGVLDVHQGIVPEESRLAGKDTFTLVDPERGQTILRAAVGDLGRTSVELTFESVTPKPDVRVTRRFLGALISRRQAVVGYLGRERTNLDRSFLKEAANSNNQGEYVFLPTLNGRFIVPGSAKVV